MAHEVKAAGRVQRRKRKDPLTDEQFKQLVVHHHFPTPSQFVRHLVRYLMREFEWSFRQAHWEQPLRILDHSCGTGVWNAIGTELVPFSYRVNVEYQLSKPIRVETAHEWRYGLAFQDYAAELDKLHTASSTVPLYDIVWGNPPFKEAEDFLHWSEKILRMGGLAINLLPIDFLGTQERTKTLHRVWRPIRTIHVPKRISFSKDGRTDQKEYVVMVHQRGVNPRFANEDFWFDWDMDAPDLPEDQVFDSVAPESEQPSFMDAWEGVPA